MILACFSPEKILCVKLVCHTLKKVGSILVSACASVCSCVRTCVRSFEISSRNFMYGFLMEKITDAFVFFK